MLKVNFSQKRIFLRQKNRSVSKVCGEVYAYCLYFIQKMCYNYFEFKLTRIARYRKDGNLYEINICNRK